MGFFNRKKKDSDFDDEDELEVGQDEPRKIRRQFKDLNSENKSARKEPLKPWGVKERLVVLIVLLATTLTSGFLALSARNFKLPSFPVIKIPNISDLNPFKEQVIVVGNRGSKVSQQKIENTKKLFNEATNEYSGIYAFYIYDIKGDYYYGLNYQETMQAASLIKLPVMYLLMKNDQNKDLVEAMGKRSDNNAFNKAINILGKEKINKTILDLGMPKTSLSENLTTPEEIGIFFKKLYNQELFDESRTKELEGYMTDTIFEDFLRPGIPGNIKLVHKYGREKHVINDAGIIIGDKPFVMVIMTDGIIESEAIDLFPKLSKLLYESHTNE